MGSSFGTFIGIVMSTSWWTGLVVFWDSPFDYITVSLVMLMGGLGFPIIFILPGFLIGYPIYLWANDHD